MVGKSACHIRKIAALSVLLCTICTGALSRERKGGWSGDFTLVGGTNLVPGDEYDRLFTRGETEFDGKVGYKEDKWDITFDIANRYDNTVKFLSGWTCDVDERIEKYKVYVDTTIRSGYNEKVRLGTIINFRPSTYNNFNFYYNCGYNYELPQREVLSINFDQDTDWSKTQIYQLTWEESELCKADHNFGLLWKHKFKSPTQSLVIRSDANFLFDTRVTLWEMGDYIDDEQKDYKVVEMSRDTPRYKTQSVGLKSQFTETSLCNVSGLEIEGSLDILFKRNFDDLCTEKYKGSNWVDSLIFKEKFDYLTITVDPKLRVRYRPGRFDIWAEYCPEYYAYRLSSDKYFGTMQTSRLEHLCGVGVTYRPSEHHSLTLSVKSTIKRPTYLNLCWFRRSGTYANEFIEGNQELLPETSNRINLEYQFKWERFSATASVGDIYAYDKIEKTFNNCVIDDVSCRIYTWVNAGWGNTVNGSLSFKWNGKSLQAELTGKINQVMNISKDGKTKNNMDYNLSGKVKYIIKAWTFTMSGNYQSQITKIYSYQTQYLGFNARAERRLGSRFKAFLEGRDLLDVPIETYTFSEDYKHSRGEIVNNNRRTYVLGVNFKF